MQRFAMRPGQLAAHETGRLRAAALRATRMYDGPVGEIVARELRASAELGYRFAPQALMERLATEILQPSQADRARPATSTPVIASTTAAAVPAV